MPRRGPRIINDYLIPNLNNGTFGKHLEWVQKDKKIFRISYKHKNSSTWTEADAAVFVEWDRLKDPLRHQPHMIEYFTVARQRMRAAIHKLTNSGHLRSLKCLDPSMNKCCMYYQILTAPKYDRRRHVNNGITGGDNGSHPTTELLFQNVPSQVAKPCDNSCMAMVWEYKMENLCKIQRSPPNNYSPFRLHTEERIFVSNCENTVKNSDYVDNENNQNDLCDCNHATSKKTSSVDHEVDRSHFYCDVNTLHDIITCFK